MGRSITLSALAKTIFTHQERGDSLSDPTIPSLVKHESLLRYKFALGYARGLSVLDIGCGYGYGSYLLSKYAKSVTAVDYDKGVIRVASAKYPKANLKFFASDAAEFLSNSAEQFELVTMFESIEHVPDQKSLLSLVKKAIVNGGKLIISTPNKKYTTFYRRNPHHLKELDIEEFASLVGEGMRVESVYGQTPGSIVLIPLPYFMLAYVIQMIPGGLRLSNFTQNASKSRTMYLVAAKSQ